MFNTYDEIKPELQYVADALEDYGMQYKAYNHGVQYNAEDYNGIIHSFYPTTGTILFRRSNKKSDHMTMSIRDSNLKTFIEYLKQPERIQQMLRDGK